jgi:hypothetical protein
VRGTGLSALLADGSAFADAADLAALVDAVDASESLTTFPFPVDDAREICKRRSDAARPLAEMQITCVIAVNRNRVRRGMPAFTPDGGIEVDRAPTPEQLKVHSCACGVFGMPLPFQRVGEVPEDGGAVKTVAVGAIGKYGIPEFGKVIEETARSMQTAFPGEEVRRGRRVRCDGEGLKKQVGGGSVSEESQRMKKREKEAQRTRKRDSDGSSDEELQRPKKNEKESQRTRKRDSDESSDEEPQRPKKNHKESQRLRKRDSDDSSNEEPQRPKKNEKESRRFKKLASDDLSSQERQKPKKSSKARHQKRNDSESSSESDRPRKRRSASESRSWGGHFSDSDSDTQTVASPPTRERSYGGRAPPWEQNRRIHVQASPRLPVMELATRVLTTGADDGADTPVAQPPRPRVGRLMSGNGNARNYDDTGGNTRTRVTFVD